MKNPIKGNKSADDYHKKVGWGKREVPMRIGNDGRIEKTTYATAERKLDIADASSKKGIEVKDYSKGNVPYSKGKKGTKEEVEFDKKLVEQGWDIEWVFIDKGPSKPLRNALNSPPPIKFKILNK